MGPLALGLVSTGRASSAGLQRFIAKLSQNLPDIDQHLPRPRSAPTVSSCVLDSVVLDRCDDLSRSSAFFRSLTGGGGRLFESRGGELPRIV